MQLKNINISKRTVYAFCTNIGASITVTDSFVDAVWCKFEKAEGISFER